MLRPAAAASALERDASNKPDSRASPHNASRALAVQAIKLAMFFNTIIQVEVNKEQDDFTIHLRSSAKPIQGDWHHEKYG
jgi:hypothetical protein